MDLNQTEQYWVDRNDNEFKFHLDRYKYPNRYENVDSLEQRELAKKYLDGLDKFLDTDEITLQLSDALFLLLDNLLITTVLGSITSTGLIYITG